MNLIDARNINGALHEALLRLRDRGKAVAPRGQATLELFGPTTTLFRKPTERVLLYPGRQPNPWLHLFEAMWLLVGRQDVGFLAQFVPRVRQFSDDGETFHGAYGHRLRHAAGVDQLNEALNVLRGDPQSRQAVLQIWSAASDLNQSTNDIPCNCLVFLKVRGGRLNMTVCNRSNDALWGAYGTDAVQFSFLQEYLATHLGLGVGFYWQMSDSLHLYTEGDGGKVWERLKPGLDQSLVDPYARGLVTPSPLIRDPTTFDVELRRFFALYDAEVPPTMDHFNEPFIQWTLIPAYVAWQYLSAKRRDDALASVSFIKSEDWQFAMLTYLDEAYLRLRLADTEETDQ